MSDPHARMLLVPAADRSAALFRYRWWLLNLIVRTRLDKAVKTAAEAMLPVIKEVVTQAQFCLHYFVLDELTTYQEDRLARRSAMWRLYRTKTARRSRRRKRSRGRR